MAANESIFSSIKKLQLVEDRELKQFPATTDPKQLVEKGLLTPYQLKMLLQGQGSSLVLGPYVLMDVLGEGGMGQVFKARHRKLDRIVALKIIRKSLVPTSASVSRFQREAKAAAKLSSPHVVGIFDAEEASGVHYMAMEFMEGTDLSKLVNKNGPLPIAQACEYIRQAALGLQHAHEKGLVHRDIKPANLFLAKTETGEIVKVLDFGLTLVEDDKERKTRLTQIGSVMGTVDFMSPEQASDSRNTDIRSDLYSLGCSLFYLLTGEPPFEGGDPIGRLFARMVQEPPSVKQVRPDVPTALEALLKKMMAKEPANRFQTPAEVVNALQPFAKRGAPRKFRSVALASLVLIATLLLCGLIAFLSMSSSVQPISSSGDKSSASTPTTSGGKPSTFSCRHLPERDKLLQDGGGNKQSEEAVSQGLKWLVQQQKADGSWSLQGYEQLAPNMGPQEVAATGFALLPFLGRGDSHQEGSYSQTIKLGLNYLIKQQQADGHFGVAMYNHAIATIAVCEAYGLTKDESLRPIAQKAIKYIIEAQHSGGGWRYTPKQEGDTSVTGWCFIALLTGTRAGLDVPKEVLDRVSLHLDSVARPDGSYRYHRTENPPSNSCTAIGILSRLHLGWDASKPELAKGISLVKADRPLSPMKTNLYSYFFATQAMYHVGGESWDFWNPKMRDMLIQKQGKDGSWSPVDDTLGKQGGRLMITSLALLTLEVYYRQIPLWKNREK